MAESPVRRSGNLPAEPTSFVGRRAEVRAVRDLLRSSRLVTLTGVGGVGKTRLAMQAASGLRERFPDGVWQVPLSGLRDPVLLAHTVASTLEVNERIARPPLELLAGHLAGRHLLLILDTCEHLLAGCAELAGELLIQCRHLSVLATSRIPLGVQGERVYAVMPLPLPGDVGPRDRAKAPAPAHGSVTGVDAVALFVDRAAEAVPGLVLDPGDLDTVARLCTLLDGLPLAIELAAARLRHLSPKEIEAALDDRFGLLTADYTPLPRHQTMRSAIGWSHELCEPLERLLWARLSVLVGDYSLDLAREVCGAAPLSPARVAELMPRLVEQSVVQREGAGFRMLDTIREYGLERLRDLGEENVVRRRHRDACLRLARRAEAEWSGPDQLGWTGRVIAEFANLRVALDHCLEMRSAKALELSAALWPLWSACGFHREGRYYLGRALEQGIGSGPELAKALWVSTWVDVEHYEAEVAAARLDLARRAAVASGDGTALAYVGHMAGLTAFVQGDDATAVELLADTLASHRPALEAAGPGPLLTMAQLGVSLARLGRADAVRTLRECVRQCRRRGELWARSIAHYGLALDAWRRGDVADADAHNRESLRIKRRFGDVAGAALGIELRAWCAAASGRGEVAARLLGGVDRLCLTTGMRIDRVPFWAAGHRECERTARGLLGDEGFDAAFRQGRDLELDETYGYALGERLGTRPRARRPGPRETS
ncbi:ATP-binding protein [Actinomadura kijaniata]|uniref:ATP-binding protein n=1 Tax=Actinomadura kijaniata TaxID=46161 RepID=UPI003F1D01BF